MPEKYHIEIKRVPPRYRPVGKLGIVDWREDCSSCHNCVKRSCVYGLFRDEADSLHDETGYLDYIYQCKGCLNCVQNCTKGILTRVVNPEYKRLGDSYYTPDIILSTWYQAETGGIPVSGAGYGGPFSGPGFNSMWTDMSEIVRPTRDGIHGREYINTSVDIGRKPGHVAFNQGEVEIFTSPLIENPMPLIFDILPERYQRGPVFAAVAQAAAKMGIFAVVRAEDLPPLPKHYPSVPGGIAVGKDEAAEHEIARNYLTPFISDPRTNIEAICPDAAMVMVADQPEIGSIIDALKHGKPERIVAIRLNAAPNATERTLELSRLGAEVIHLVFNSHGREAGAAKPRHMRDVLRDVHGALVKAGTRDEITLIASGGIALPEHMAKAVICGADLIAVDLPLVVALECRLCGECGRGEPCPVRLENTELEGASQRIVNLIGAWRNQLLELLGAMGIREARRLRGETGRSMFFEDLEEATFGRIFGKRKEEYGA
ncbi:hypothetical protein JXA32_08125 [Candidatus Sumerlaeota bacterium]|nr:hypothetical protein [Candidatus Sumerlaeota bacterium]